MHEVDRVRGVERVRRAQQRAVDRERVSRSGADDQDRFQAGEEDLLCGLCRLLGDRAGIGGWAGIVGRVGRCASNKLQRVETGTARVVNAIDKSDEAARIVHRYHVVADASREIETLEASEVHRDSRAASNNRH